MVFAQIRHSWCGQILAAGIAVAASAQTGPQDEPPAKIVIDPPRARALSLGEVVIPFRTENLQVTPVFGQAALSVYPRVGHLHVSVDDERWVWAHTSANPVTVFGLSAGRHKMRLQLMTANHQRLDEGAVEFVVPEAPTRAPEARQSANELGGVAKIIVGEPLPEPLSRGVVLIRYRTENVDILPVYGSAALAVSPRIAHVHVTLDGSPWYWTEASGGPVIVQGLTPGRHQIRIELVDADHQVIDRGTIEVAIGGAKSQAAESRRAKGESK